MKYLLFVTIFCLAGSLYAQDSKKDYVQLSEPVEQTADYQVFGSTFDMKVQSVNLDKLITQSEKFEDKEVSTDGVIKQVCQKKGCFFMLENDEATGQARISFKDYSFFIPTNTAGSRVKLNGTFKVNTVSEEDAKHYAEDAGKNSDHITGDQKEYTLVATSVVIYR